jgi:hypothetical protein
MAGEGIISSDDGVDHAIAAVREELFALGWDAQMVAAISQEDIVSVLGRFCLLEFVETASEPGDQD